MADSVIVKYTYAGDANLDGAAVVHFVAQPAIAEPADDLAHAGLGIVLDVPHVVDDRVVARTPDERTPIVLVRVLPRVRKVIVAPGAVPAAMLRQNGVPVHDVALSRQKF